MHEFLILRLAKRLASITGAKVKGILGIGQIISNNLHRVVTTGELICDRVGKGVSIVSQICFYFSCLRRLTM